MRTLRILLHAPAESTAMRAHLRAAARAALRDEGIRHAEISISLQDDGAMAELHRVHLGKDGTTDVIAFDLGGASGVRVGDIYIGVEQAERQARELGIGRGDELARLVVHGVLHVLGEEHPESAEERGGSPMYQRQERILALLPPFPDGAP